jgi:hypothetical protein
MGRAMPQCPQCEVIELRRQGRTGFLQKVIWSYFGYYPWECGLCRQVYMLKQRTIEYRHPGQTQRSSGESLMAKGQS